MNFNQRIAWIQRSLTQASAKRTALLTSIPVLIREIDALIKESDAAEGMYEKMVNLCGDEWSALIDEVDVISIEINGELDQAQMALEDAECSLNTIEGYVESACYCAVDAAKA